MKRNATDKHRRVSKTTRDADEMQAAQRARGLVVATTAVQALATRPRSESAPSRQRIASLTVRGPRYPQPGLFDITSSVESREVRSLPGRSAVLGNMLASSASQLSLRDIAPPLSQQQSTSANITLSQPAVDKDTKTDTPSSTIRMLEARPAAQRTALSNHPVDVSGLPSRGDPPTNE